MKKLELKQNLYIEGFEHEWEYRKRLYGNTGISNSVKVLYQGKTSEIPEELAKECVRNYNIDGLYENYKMSSQYGEYMYETAKESIKSACSQDFCIIFRELLKHQYISDNY